MSIFCPSVFSMSWRACLITVRVFSPRKSNLMRPSFSIWSMVNWVMTSSLVP